LRFALGGNDGLDAADFEMLDEAVAIIAFVGEEGCGFDFRSRLGPALRRERVRR
jgi:hypothetical protein